MQHLRIPLREPAGPLAITLIARNQIAGNRHRPLVKPAHMEKLLLSRPLHIVNRQIGQIKRAKPRGIVTAIRPHIPDHRMIRLHPRPICQLIADILRHILRPELIHQLRRRHLPAAAERLHRPVGTILHRIAADRVRNEMHPVLRIRENPERRLPERKLQIAAVHRRIEITLFQHIRHNLHPHIQNPPKIGIVLQIVVCKIQTEPAARRRRKTAHHPRCKDLITVPCTVMPDRPILASSRIQFIIHTVERPDIRQLEPANLLPAPLIRMALLHQLPHRQRNIPSPERKTRRNVRGANQRGQPRPFRKLLLHTSS